jgi:hypothetical protein
MTKSQRTKIADQVAKELQNGGVTEKALEGFGKLMGQKLTQEVAFKSPHFGIAPLPDDDW